MINNSELNVRDTIGIIKRMNIQHPATIYYPLLEMYPRSQNKIYLSVAMYSLIHIKE